ncbi:hypothetical protein, partial [Burkholderia ubonensis]|uniref:hypothetical protein n=1 Tax=Burkholderia ubonensis TaxID=101571 RepID=UPI001E3FC55C
SEWWILLPASHTRASLSSRLVCNGMRLTISACCSMMDGGGDSTHSAVTGSFKVRIQPVDATN